MQDEMILTLSPEQERLWYLQQLYPNSNFLNCVIAIRLTGEIASNIINDCIVKIVERQSVLRSYFPDTNGKPHCKLSKLSQYYLIQTQLPAQADSAYLDAYIQAEVNQPLSLTAGPLFKPILAKITESEFIFLLVIHHIIADAKTLELFIKELVIHYECLVENKVNPLPALPYSYYEVLKKQPILDEFTLEESKQYWSKKLAQNKPLNNLPGIADRTGNKYSTDKSVLRLTPELTQAILQWCEKQKVSPNTLFLTVFEWVIARITSQYNFLIGMAVDNRAKGTSEHLMGYFGVPVILGATLKPDTTFLQAAQQMQTEIMTTLLYRDLPLSAISSLYKVNGQQTHLPLLQLMFSYVGYLPVNQSAQYFDYEILTIDRGGADFDLFFTVVLSAERYIIGLQYNSSLFNKAIVAAIVETLEQCLIHALDNSEILTAQLKLPDLLAHHIQAQPITLLPIAATFTAEPLANALDFWLTKLNWPLRYEFAPYNQLLSELLSPVSLFFNQHGWINIILIRFEDIIKYEQNNTLAQINDYLDELIAALFKATQRTGKQFLIGICPSTPLLQPEHGNTINFDYVEEEFSRKLAAIPGVYIINSKAWQAYYSVATVHDQAAEQLGHMPYTPEFYTSIATLLMRRLHQIKAPLVKALVLDCDNTLWQGVVGEEGSAGIKLTGPYLFLQQFIVELVNKGILVCLCSKNNEADVLEVFAKRTDMLLTLDHIAHYRINWHAKSQNIKVLAQELNIGLDTLVFIDDNPIECAEVHLNCPAVLTIQLPSEPENIPVFLQHLWLLDQDATTKTTEDNTRTRLYLENSKREQLKQQTLDYNSFIESLNLNIKIVPVNADNLARAVQLTLRTNQFNTTTWRLYAADLQRLSQTEKIEIWLADVADRFGQYGYVGLMLAEITAKTLKVDVLLLSCRSLGRGVEHKMLAYLGDYAKQMQLDEISIVYQATIKNAPVFAFLENLPILRKENINDKILYIISTEQAQNIKFDAAGYQENTMASTAMQANATVQPLMDTKIYEAIANDWHDIKQIYAAINQAKSLNATAISDQTPPGNAIEQQLLALWQAVLGDKSIGIYADFFALGGSSIQFVQLVAKIMQTFALKINYDVFLEKPTIQQMAHVITTMQSAADSLHLQRQIATDFSSDVYLYNMPEQNLIPALNLTSKPEYILLTGATGFLGAYLLRELLVQTQATIYCLVRAANQEQGLARIQHNLARYHIWSEQYRPRIRVILGDLAKPYFGLSQAVYQQLAAKLDCIYHNGAVVNFIYPYHALRTANVASTREIIRLASLEKIKPIHFISSIGIFDGATAAKEDCIAEEQMPDDITKITTGYFQSKYVAEQLVNLAREQGIPCMIYRPGNITGDTYTGVGATDDLFSRMLQTCLEFKLFPDLEIEIVPVDYVSQAIVAIAQHNLTNSNYHIINQNRLLVSDYVQWANQQGMQLQLLNLQNWLCQVTKIISNDTQHPLYPFLPIMQSKEFFQAASQRPFYNNINTQTVLKNTTIKCPIINQHLLSTYTAFYTSLCTKQAHLAN